MGGPILTIPGQPCECGCYRYLFVSETPIVWHLNCEKCGSGYELEKPRSDENRLIPAFDPEPFASIPENLIALVLCTDGIGHVFRVIDTKGGLAPGPVCGASVEQQGHGSDDEPMCPRCSEWAFAWAQDREPRA